jgi:hypothetical protein
MFRATKYKLLNNVIIENSFNRIKKFGKLGCSLHAIEKPLMKRILWRCDIVISRSKAREVLNFEQLLSLKIQ